MQLQQARRAGPRGTSSRSAARSQIDVISPSRVDADPHVVVLEDEAVAVRPGRDRRRRDRHRRDGQRGHAVDRVRTGVRARGRRARTEQRPERVVDHLSGRLGDPGVAALGLGVAPTRSTCPGRMSWNCCRQHRRATPSRSASYGYAAPVRTAAVAAHSSASRSRCSLRRLPRFVRAWRGVGAAVELQVQLARPDRRRRAARPARRRRTRPGRPGAPSASPRGRACAARPRSSRGWVRRRRRRSRTAPATRWRAAFSAKCRSRAGQVARPTGRSCRCRRAGSA